MNIIGSVAKDDLVTLGGRQFKRVKNGLDEAEVASFIGELLNDRDKLAQAQEHIASLNRLAERAIVEADKLAAQIKAEAAERAKAESAAILDKAKEQARRIVEEKLAQATELANEKANAIKAKAEQEAATLLESERARVRNELRNLVDGQFGHLLEELERLKQDVVEVQAGFHVRLSEPVEEIRAPTAQVQEMKQTPAAKAVEEKPATVAEERKRTLAEALELSHSPAEDGGRSPEVLESFQAAQEPETDKPQWEVEIMPPFEIARIMDVVSFLDQLPEVANTEMVVPQIDVPLILVFLRQPMDVVGVLRKVPAVSHVEEVVGDKAASNGRPRKVRISLAADKRL